MGGRLFPKTYLRVSLSPCEPERSSAWLGDCSADGMALITTPSTEVVIGCAIRVHSQLGPGLFESIYEKCLAVEMRGAGLRFSEQTALSVNSEGTEYADAFRADFVVENELIVEVKSIERFLPVHSRQVLTYMRLAGLKKGLLINFHVTLLKHGIKSFVL